VDECPEFSYKDHVGTFFDQVRLCSFGFPWSVVPFGTVLGFSVGDRVLPMVVFVLAVVGGHLGQVFAFSVIGATRGRFAGDVVYPGGCVCRCCGMNDGVSWPQ
jgi:hypothetical protein